MLVAIQVLLLSEVHLQDLHVELRREQDQLAIQSLEASFYSRDPRDPLVLRVQESQVLPLLPREQLLSHLPELYVCPFEYFFVILRVYLNGHKLGVTLFVE